MRFETLPSFKLLDLFFQINSNFYFILLIIQMQVWQTILFNFQLRWHYCIKLRGTQAAIQLCQPGFWYIDWFYEPDSSFKICWLGNTRICSGSENLFQFRNHWQKQIRTTFENASTISHFINLHVPSSSTCESFSAYL